MSNVVKHRFQSTKGDSADTSKIRPSNWNDDHPFSGGSHLMLLQRDTGASDGASWTDSPSILSLTASGQINAASLALTGNALVGGNLTVTGALVAGSLDISTILTASSPLTLGSSGAFALRVLTNNIERWNFDSNGHLIAFADATYDIGASGANRPRDLFLSRDLYLATSLRLGTNPAASGAIRLANAASIFGRNAANGADVEFGGIDAADTVRLGAGWAFATSSGLRVPASGYLNFGATAGTTGYGVRDNAGAMEFKNSGGAWTAFGGTSAPVGAQYLTLLADATLTDERVLTAGNGISLTDAGAGSTATLAAKHFVLDQVTANTTVGNTTTETTIYTKSITGGTLGSANALRLTIIGTVTDSALDTSTAITFRFKYGATTLHTLARTTDDGTITFGGAQVFRFVFELSADGATNAQIAHLSGLCPTISGGAVTFTPIGTRGTAAIDSTANQNLVVTAQWNAANANSTMTMERAMLEVVA